MQRPFALTLHRPSEALGIPVPMSRRLARTEIHPVVWLVLLIAVSLFSIGFYIFQVSASSQKTYTMRQLDKKTESLEETVAQLDQQVTLQQAMPSLEARVKELGFVPVDRYEFIHVSDGYAFAK